MPMSGRGLFNMVEVVMDNDAKQRSGKGTVPFQDQFNWIEEEEGEPNYKQAAFNWSMKMDKLADGDKIK